MLRDDDIETEEWSSPSDSDGLIGDGGGATVFSVFQPERRWTMSKERMTRGNQSSRFWSTVMGMRHSPHSAPPSSLFTEGTTTSNPMRTIDPAFFSPGDDTHQQSIHLSSRLPHCIWVVLAKCLGIKLSENDRPILATILHILTVASALTFAIPGAWYTVYDIESEFSKTTVLIGTVQLVIGFAWACLGIYSHNLAGRLFQNKNFVECVRVHSKTFMKISTTWLTFFLGTGILVVNCYEASPIFYDNSCGTAQVEILVCQVFFAGRVTLDTLSLVWNFIVTYVLFSACRTQTVGIRQLMRELTFDARIYESLCLKQFHIQKGDMRETLNNLEESWYLWDDSGHMGREEDAVKSHGVFLRSVNASTSSHPHTFSLRLHNHRFSRSTSEGAPAATIEEGEEGRVGDGTDGEGGEKKVKAGTAASRMPQGSIQEEDGSQIGGDNTSEVFSQFDEEDRINPSALLTNEDLLFTYWKFIRRLSVTSRYLQRWLASWVVFVFLWDGYFIIFWTSHQASLTDILQFSLPLLILLLVSSAYAEVNAEGQRLLKTVCPSEERLAVIYYFNQYPLTIGVFGIPVTYNIMVTAILAFSVAFASRMILDEISG